MSTQGLPENNAVVGAGQCISFPSHWQEPAATEKAAYEAVFLEPELPNVIYVGFPWATLIDSLRRRSYIAAELFSGLRALRESLCDCNAGPRATVVQHIHADRFAHWYKSLGITDLFWPHALKSRPKLDGIRVHGFPLFPAQAAEAFQASGQQGPRPWLANFIGAYNPGIYLSDVRDHIFRDAGASDLLIVRRDAWHFERAVYEQQILGVAPDEVRLALEARYRSEYIDALKGSLFTLCPTGSGPNSIRICEAMAFASIPIILTQDLALPGDSELWHDACLFESDDVGGYRKALERARHMSSAEIQVRQEAVRRLFDCVRPQAYGSIIRSVFA